MYFGRAVAANKEIESKGKKVWESYTGDMYEITKDWEFEQINDLFARPVNKGMYEDLVEFANLQRNKLLEVMRKTSPDPRLGRRIRKVLGELSDLEQQASIELSAANISKHVDEKGIVRIVRAAIARRERLANDVEKNVNGVIADLIMVGWESA